ncbi:NfeD family protein [Corynebacterium sp. 335C]
MTPAIVFVIAGLLLIIGEVLIGDLSMLMLGIAALIAAGAAFAGLPLWGVIAVFAVAVALLMLLVRPPLKRRLAAGPDHRVESTPEQLAGRGAIVVEPVGADAGIVRLGGELWSARALPGGAGFPEGARVTVVVIDGNTAIVDKEI